MKLLTAEPGQPSPGLVTKRINTKFMAKAPMYVDHFVFHDQKKLVRLEFPWVNAVVCPHMEMSSSTEIGEQLIHMTAWTNHAVREARPQRLHSV